MTLRRFILVGSIVAIACSAILSMPNGNARAAADPDLEQLVEEFVDALSAPRDLAAVASLAADDIVVTDVGADSYAVIGEPAFVGILAAEDAEGFEEQATILSSDADGNVVSGRVETSSTAAEEAGVTRYRQLFEITFNEDALITRIDLTYDKGDAQTREYLKFLDEGGEGGGGEPPDGTAVIPLAAQPGGNQPGSAYIMPGAAPDTSLVVLVIEPGEDGVLQPAHLHTGTCAAPGPIVYSLASVLNGDSFTAISASVDEITAQELIVNVHRSATQATQYVSCGEVLSAAATPTAMPAATATSTPPTGIVAPNTGAGPSSDDGVPALAIVALLLAGVTLVGVPGAARRLRR